LAQQFIDDSVVAQRATGRWDLYSDRHRDVDHRADRLFDWRMAGTVKVARPDTDQLDVSYLMVRPRRTADSRLMDVTDQVVGGSFILDRKWHQ
jgi:hypothetical protein